MDADIISKTDPKHCSQWVNNLTVDDPEIQALIQENVRMFKVSYKFSGKQYSV